MFVAHLFLSHLGEQYLAASLSSNWSGREEHIYDCRTRMLLQCMNSMHAALYLTVTEYTTLSEVFHFFADLENTLL